MRPLGWALIRINTVCSSLVPSPVRAIPVSGEGLEKRRRRKKEKKKIQQRRKRGAILVKALGKTRPYSRHVPKFYELAKGIMPIPLIQPVKS